MNELEKAAEKYAEILAFKSDAKNWAIASFIKGATSEAAKQYHTKEAMELIKELVKTLKETDDCDSVYEMVTKAENFLNSNK